MSIVKKAVVPIAGLGSRFLPATKACAKELFPVVNIPALLYVLEECANSGIEEVLIVASPNKTEAVKRFLTPDVALEQKLASSGKLGYLNFYNNVMQKLKIDVAVQKVARGSGDAILVARDWVKGEPFAVLFGDDLDFTPKGMLPAIGQCIEAYEKTRKLVVGCQTVDRSVIHKYSSCIIDAQLSENAYAISGIIEKPAPNEAPSNLSGLARYVLTPDIFDVLEHTPIDIRGELGLTDAMNIIAKEKGAVACNFQAVRYDTGDKLGFVVATIEYAMRDPEIAGALKNYLASAATKDIYSPNLPEVEEYGK